MFPKRFNREMEEKWQKFWEEHNIHKFDENDTTREIYSIDTPPPFTSGQLHMGHVLSYSFFDFAARYKRLRGYNVYYPQGWDCQGFPTEVKVEKKYGRLPKHEFVQKCVEWTHEFIGKMRNQMKTLGFSPDWNYEYKTMDKEYHRKVQLSLIKMYKDNLVYRKAYPVYWCPHCHSAVAKAELNDVEKDGQIYTIIFKTESGKELRIATTRPELLPACQAVAIHPDDERYKDINDNRVITPLGKSVKLLRDKDVDKEFGTGIVMICTFGDKQDVVWKYRYDLPVKIIFTEYGKLTDTGIAGLDGLNIKDARKKILEILKQKHALVESKSIHHTVKVHDRCGTPIELMPSMQWFADIKNTSRKIKEMAHKIKWIPKFGISYLTNWADTVEWDWVISRQRAFGTPIPFYYCPKCGYTEPVDENKLPFYTKDAEQKVCPKCGEQMKPEESVCDCWVDSSITPLIISGWPDNKEMFNRIYPTSLRPQGVEIVRTWAFYTIYRSGVALTGKPPWKEIFLNGNVLAPDGKKMSKSLGNVISPDKLLEQYPADAIRQWAAMSGAMAKDRPFSYEDIKYARNFLTKLWNASRFIFMLAPEDIDKDKINSLKLKPIDLWILNRADTVTKQITAYLDNYEYQKAIHTMHEFFWHEFCDDYIEFVKYRINENIFSDEAKYTLRYVLLRSLILLFPITPHISEEIYSILFKCHPTITKEKWPEKDELKYLDLGTEEERKEVEYIREGIKQIRQYKAKQGISQGKELDSITITFEINEGENEEIKNKQNEKNRFNELPSEKRQSILNELKKIGRVKEINIK